ncbi:MAG: tRNA pseudouridine(55) synthase TruB [Planctomycetota bacterium]|nr:tRNA pseudouridine(55) synthase TruB [Planctomycetota bacterium]
MSQPSKPNMSGVIVLDKPRGPTSMSMVNMIRRKCHKTKTGHAGTLDPLATGVLVLGVGKMTKQLGKMMATDKAYETVIDLSGVTAGHDEETEPEAVVIETTPTDSQIHDAVASFKGEITQSPPIHSAVKVGGQRAYKVARMGEDVNLKSRQVMVYDIRVVNYEWPLVTIHIECAKGFYVRSLARDLGKVLGTGGYCKSIKRTAVGPFTLEMAWQLEDLPEFLAEDELLTPLQVETLLQG